MSNAPGTTRPTSIVPMDAEKTQTPSKPKTKEFVKHLVKIANSDAFARFQYDNPPTSNIFREIEGEQTSREVRYSKTLRWLLDPNGTHGLGSYFADSLLQLIITRDWAKNSNNEDVGFLEGWPPHPPDAIDEGYTGAAEGTNGAADQERRLTQTYWVRNTTKAFSEQKKIDIWVEGEVHTELELGGDYSPGEATKHVLLIIENKTGTGESEAQTLYYRCFFEGIHTDNERVKLRQKINDAKDGENTKSVPFAAKVLTPNMLNTLFSLPQIVLMLKIRSG